MPNCPNCGAGLQPGATKCLKCGSAVEVQQQAGAPGAAPAAPGMVATKDVSPFLAAFLSWLLMGLGQIYIGQTTKGIVLLVLGLLFYVIDIVTCGIFLFVHGPIAIVFIIDAAMVAGKVKSGQPVSQWRFF